MDSGFHDQNSLECEPVYHSSVKVERGKMEYAQSLLDYSATSSTYDIPDVEKNCKDADGSETIEIDDDDNEEVGEIVTAHDACGPSGVSVVCAHV